MGIDLAERPLDHLECCDGCEWCTGSMDCGWQTCEACGQWGNDLLSIPPGFALCSGCEPRADDPAFLRSLGIEP